MRPGSHVVTVASWGVDCIPTPPGVVLVDFAQPYAVHTSPVQGGMARTTIDYPHDIGLVGTPMYFQSFSSDAGGIRELSHGLRLVFCPPM